MQRSGDVQIDRMAVRIGRPVRVRYRRGWYVVEDGPGDIRARIRAPDRPAALRRVRYLWPWLVPLLRADSWTLSADNPR